MKKIFIFLVLLMQISQLHADVKKLTKNENTVNIEKNFIYNMLKKMDKTFGGENYSGVFFMREDETFFEWWLRGESAKTIEIFKKNFKIFASPDGTGSMSAFWLIGEDDNLDKMPIVKFDSEGGVKIVASDIRDLLKLMSVDDVIGYELEIENEDDIKKYVKKILIYRPYFMIFRKIMKENLNIEPIKLNCNFIDEFEKIQEKAVKNYRKSFKEWNKKVLPNYPIRIIDY